MKQKRKWSIVAILFGVLLMIAGFYIAINGSYYGADLYSDLSIVIHAGLGWLIMGLGGFDIFYFTIKLTETKENKKQEDEKLPEI